MCIEGIQLYVMLVEVFESESSPVKWYYMSAYGKYLPPTKLLNIHYFDSGHGSDNLKLEISSASKSCHGEHPAQS